MDGWIKLHRRILEWEWWDDSKTRNVFLTLILMANHKPTKWRGMTIDCGQVLTGRKQLSKISGITEQSVRTSLNRLKSTSELTIKTTNGFSVITICKWNEYQTNQPASQPASQPATNQQLTTSKNEKNEKNENNGKFSKPALDDVKAYCVERGNAVNSEAFMDYYQARGWMLKKTPMKDWRAAVRTWEKNTDPALRRNGEDFHDWQVRLYKQENS